MSNSANQVQINLALIQNQSTAINHL